MHLHIHGHVDSCVYLCTVLLCLARIWIKLQIITSYYNNTRTLDGHQEQNLMKNISVERSGEMVNMSVDGEIPTKTLWNASLLAYGCQSDIYCGEGGGVK